MLCRLPDSDLDWLECHTKHDRQEIVEMFEGFRDDFKGGLELEQLVIRTSFLYTIALHTYYSSSHLRN